MFSSFNSFRGTIRKSKKDIPSNAPTSLTSSNITDTGFTLTFTQPTTGSQLSYNPITSFTTVSLGRKTATISFTQS